MQLTLSQDETTTIVTPDGPRLDALHTLGFKEGMRKVISETQGPLRLDMRAVDFLDSSGLGAIVSVSRILGNERPLELAHLTPIVAKVFRLTKMDQVFTIHGDNAEPVQ